MKMTRKHVSQQLAFMRVFSIRPFLFIWLAQVASQLAINIMLFLLALVAYKQTGSNTAVSGIFIAYGVPAVLFGLVAGTFVDSADKRLVIIYSNLIRTVLSVGLLFVSHNMVFVYILMFLNAFVTQFYVPATAPLLPRFVPPAQLMVANSLFSFAYYASMALGFIIAGPMLRAFGPFVSLAILAFCFALATFFSWKLPNTEKDGAVSIFEKIKKYSFFPLLSRVSMKTKAGISYVMNSRDLFDGVVLLTGTQIIIALLGALGPGFADQILGIDILDVSLVIIGPAVVGLILGAFWIGNIGYKFTSEFLIRTGIISSGVILFLVAATVYLESFARFGWLFSKQIIIPIELLLFFLLGVANSFIDIPANSVLQKKAEGEMRGRVYGLLGAFVGGVGILPVMIGGILADVIGVGKVIFFLGIVIMIYGGVRMRRGK